MTQMKLANRGRYGNPLTRDDEFSFQGMFRFDNLKYLFVILYILIYIFFYHHITQSLILIEHNAKIRLLLRFS